MIIFKKGVGKLHNLSYYELQKIKSNIPDNWELDYKCIYDLSVDEKYNKYNVKLYRKQE